MKLNEQKKRIFNYDFCMNFDLNRTGKFGGIALWNKSRHPHGYRNVGIFYLHREFSANHFSKGDATIYEKF